MLSTLDINTKPFINEVVCFRASKFMRIFLFYSLLCLCSMQLYSADFSFKQFDSRHGLSSDIISGFCQDKEGMVWIATSNGLNSYSGNRFQVYDTFGKNRENISALTVADNGDVWLGTLDNGITVFNRLEQKEKKFTTQSGEYSISGDKINDIICDSKGRIWFSTSGGLNMYDNRLDSMFFYDLNGEYVNLNGDLFEIYEDSKGRIFIGTWWHSLFCYDELSHSFNQLMLEDGSAIPKVWAICEDVAGDIWVGTWGNGLYKLKVDGCDKIELLDQVPIVNAYFDKEIVFNIVYDITVDKQNRLWLGTDVGLGMVESPDLDEVSIEWIPLEYGEQDYLLKDITEVFVDAEESLWIGTVEYGMCLAKPEGLAFKTHVINTGKRGPSTNTFTAFWEMDEQLFVGVQTLGFGAYDINSGQFTSYKKQNDFKAFYHLPSQLNAIVKAEEADNDYWWYLTRYMGLIRYDANDNDLYQVPIAGMNRDEMSFALDGNNVWLSDRDDLVLLLENTNDDQRSPYLLKQFQSKDMPRSNISGLYKDSRGVLWISSLDGGVMKAVKENHSYDYNFNLLDVKGAEKFNKTKVQVAFEDSKHNMWFGTVGSGLWFYSNAKNTIYSYNSGTTNEDMTVFAIQEDSFGNMWCSTDRGLFYIVPNSGQVIRYTMNDGVQGNVFLKNSSFKDSQGRLFFGGSHGFNVVDPHLITFNDYIPPLAFTSLIVDDKPVTVNYQEGEALVLNHAHKSFAIEYAALSYKSSEDNHYAYQLEGFDELWINAYNNINRVVYGKLSPGRYTFKLKGSNNNGVWNNIPIKLDVLVKRSPYLTIWAYIIYFILFSSLAYTVFYFWNKDAKLKRAIEEEQKERLKADQLNQFKLRFFTNISHELLTPLSIISNATEQIDLTKKYIPENFSIITRNTKRLLHLINQLLDFRKTETGVKSPKVCKSDIEVLINDLHESFASLCEKKGISFSMNGYVGHPVWIDPDFLDKILHNILSNAFKYTPEGGQIKFTYRLNDEKSLYVAIQDSGTGIKEEDIEKIFTRFYRSVDNQKIAGAGIGLAYTRSLVELHKGKIWASNNEEAGATFYVELPVYQEAFAENELSADSREIQSTAFTEDIEQSTQTLGVQKYLSEEHKGKVLVVEDNHDMRSIIKAYLAHYFTVFEAENGVKALEIIDKQDVDVVVSDVMMPEMDGIALCRHIKTQVKTSHIPVILMTAKRTSQDMIEGYDALADSYLAKPVSMEMLLVRIGNIMKQRNVLKSAASKVDEAIIEKSGISDIDKTFLEKINRVIKDNIANADFLTSDLYASMNSSESVVFRKVKALTGKSPNQYIREVRLNIAAQMIRKGGKPLEVCYRAGFTDPSYFSACFKKQFGVTPSKYLKS